MPQEQSIGFFAKIQQYIDSIFTSLHISARDVISYVTCFGIGFFIGIALKRYGRWIVMVTLAATMIIALLHYFELITVHTMQIRCLLGLQDVHTIDDVVAVAQDHMQKILIEIILVIVACMVGFKLG